MGNKDNNLLDGIDINKYLRDIVPNQGKIFGRDKEVDTILSTFYRPQICNVLLLGDAGAGKTTIVAECARLDTKREYKELDLSMMAADIDVSAFAGALKMVFESISSISGPKEKETVLFIDECHLLSQISPAGIEAIKPMLARSGQLQIKCIFATTNIEYNEFLAHNLPFIERLHRIRMEEPSKKVVLSILKDLVEKSGMKVKLYSATQNDVLSYIYSITQRYLPSNSQPRKSILLLDACIGYAINKGVKIIDKDMVRQAMFDSYGVNLDFETDATKLQQDLDEAVLAQQLATKCVASKLHICLAGLNNDDKPLASFLFTGSTGVGKTELSKQMAKLLFDEGTKCLVRFDMSEYSQELSVERFRQSLTRAVWQRPNCVLLMDEIEKSCPAVTRLLLQVLDDARLVDEHERVVTFNNAYIILTTNAASEVYEHVSKYNQSDTGDGANFADLQKLIRRSIEETTEGKFPPELLGRIDVIVPFSPLTQETKLEILNRKYEQLQRKVFDNFGIKLLIKDDVLPILLADTSDSSKEGGARAAISMFNMSIVSEVAKYINEHGDLRTIVVQYEGKSRYHDKYIRQSTGHFVVKPQG